MPTLDFKGKQFVYSHHLSVPFRELVIDEKKSLPPKGQKPSLDDNLIIHGDNLEALKALMPTHAAKVDLIFIDPPYNTGNEDWRYNDNVRSALMKEWLKKSAKPVDKEDLERHDKWLCMMWPRLILLRELLAEDGLFFCCIDDNELGEILCILREIFQDNIIGVFPRRTKTGGGSAASHFAIEHDYVICAAKDKKSIEKLYHEFDEEYAERYSEEDEIGRYYWDTLARSSTATTPYQIEAPDGTKLDGRWFKSESTFLREKERGDIRFTKKADGTWSVQFKQRMPRGKKLRSLLVDKKFKSLSSEVNEFGLKFDYPKPVELLNTLLEVATDRHSLVLDSFAGSGTTAHAVLAANKRDGGNRRFILVECENYADTLTAERVRRVARGYKYNGTQKKVLYEKALTWRDIEYAPHRLLPHVESVIHIEGAEYDTVEKTLKKGRVILTGIRRIDTKAPGLGGSFTFCTLGEPLNVEALLTGKEMPSFETLARYIYYTATGESLEKRPKSNKSGFVGENALFRIHLHYKPDKEWLRSNDAALNADLVEVIERENSGGKRAVVFAVAKFMSQKELTKRRIEFCQLPYAIHRILGD